MIYTNIIELPSSVREFVHETSDGDYVVFINSKLDHVNQLAAYNHALSHIKEHDFDAELDADLIESKRL